MIRFLSQHFEKMHDVRCLRKIFSNLEAREKIIEKDFDNNAGKCSLQMANIIGSD